MVAKTLGLLAVQPSLASVAVGCDKNYDCIETTFCCSTSSCAHPNICLNGLKLDRDYCDYNFECNSRCCSMSKCAHYLMCYEQCSRNADCEQTKCCSEGFCTHDIVCAGNKKVGDYCAAPSECESGQCANKMCRPIRDDFPPWAWVLLGFVGFVVLIALCCLGGHFYQQRKGEQAGSHAEDRGSRGTRVLRAPQMPVPRAPKYHATPIQEEEDEYKTESIGNFMRKRGSSSNSGLESPEYQSEGKGPLASGLNPRSFTRGNARNLQSVDDETRLTPLLNSSQGPSPKDLELKEGQSKGFSKSRTFADQRQDQL